MFERFINPNNSRALNLHVYRVTAAATQAQVRHEVHYADGTYIATADDVKTHGLFYNWPNNKYKAGSQSVYSDLVKTLVTTLKTCHKNPPMVLIHR